MSGLTLQQEYVLERLKGTNQTILTMNEGIRGRANFITGASTAIIGLISAAKFLPSNASSAGFEYILLSLVLLCSIGIYFFASQVWRGGQTSLSGTTDVDRLYDSYISQDLDNAYHNFVADLAKSMDENRKENARQGQRLDWLIRVFVLQLVVLAIAISWPSIQTYM